MGDFYFGFLGTGALSQDPCTRELSQDSYKYTLEAL